MKYSPRARASASDTCTRRDCLRFAALGSIALAMPAEVAARSEGRPKPKRPAALDPGAGGWQTWLGPALSGLAPPPPSNGSFPTRAELAELLRLQARRTAATNAVAAFWDEAGGVPAWSRILLSVIKETRTDPVRAARAIALFQAAVADAAIGVWQAKFRHRRLAPARRDPRLRSLSEVDLRLPSYPSEHAAVAAAAAGL